MYGASEDTRYWKGWFRTSPAPLAYLALGSRPIHRIACHIVQKTATSRRPWYRMEGYPHPSRCWGPRWAGPWKSAWSHDLRSDVLAEDIYGGTACRWILPRHSSDSFGLHVPAMPWVLPRKKTPVLQDDHIRLVPIPWTPWVRRDKRWHGSWVLGKDMQWQSSTPSQTWCQVWSASKRSIGTPTNLRTRV